MTNLATSLKQEMSRIARKEMREEIAALRKTSATQKSQITALRKELAAIQPQLRALAKAIAKATPAVVKPMSADGIAPATRAKPGRKVEFSPQRLQEARKRFGFTQAQMASLLEVSNLTIYNWEGGHAAPRASRTASILETLALGKRAALARLKATSTKSAAA